MKYRKKPVVIEAVRWTGLNWKEMHEFIDVIFALIPHSRQLEIPTLEGVMKADVGDYIVKGVHGEFYPVKPDIFKETYVKEVEL